MDGFDVVEGFELCLCMCVAEGKVMLTSLLYSEVIKGTSTSIPCVSLWVWPWEYRYAPLPGSFGHRPRGTIYHCTEQNTTLTHVEIVNDPAPIPPPHPTEGSYHWTFERLAYLLPKKIFDICGFVANTRAATV